MPSAKQVLVMLGVGAVVGLSACGSNADRSAEVTTSAKGPLETSEPATSAASATSEPDVVDTRSGLEALTSYAAEWSIVLTDDEVQCVSDNLDEEFQSGGESLGTVDIAFFLLACEVDVTTAVGGEGRSPLEAIVAALLADEDTVLTDELVTCATDALVAGFGAEGFIDLLFSGGEPTTADDAVAEEAFDSCGLDGNAIVNS